MEGNSNGVQKFFFYIFFCKVETILNVSWHHRVMGSAILNLFYRLFYLGTLINGNDEFFYIFGRNINKVIFNILFYIATKYRTIFNQSYIINN